MDPLRQQETFLAVVGHRSANQALPNGEKSPKKTMVSVWWSVAVVIHNNFLKPGQTITAVSYCVEIDEMYRKLSQQQPALINGRNPILLHDNARPHVLQSLSENLSPTN